MNDNQRKMARKSGKPAGYRHGGRVRGYADGGEVSAMRDKAIRDAARSDLFGPVPKGEDAIHMRERALREVIRSGDVKKKPEKGRSNPPRGGVRG